MEANMDELVFTKKIRFKRDCYYSKNEIEKAGLVLTNQTSYFLMHVIEEFLLLFNKKAVIQTENKLFILERIMPRELK